MFKQKISRRFHLIVVAASLSLAAVSTTLPGSAYAADPLKESTSLGFVPDDVGFYSSTLRNREKLDAFLNSNAFARIKEMPFFKSMQQQLPMLQMMVMMQVGNPELLQEPLALLGDMFSNEIFIYGSQGFAEDISLLNKINPANQFGQLQGLLKNGGNPGNAQARQILITLNEHRDKIKVSDLVIGFKLTNTNRAKQQLAQLESLLTEKFKADPDLSKRFKKTTIAGHEYLTFTADGEMIPWDEVPIEEMEETEGEFKALIEKLNNTKLTITLGVRNDYLLLSLGESSEHIKAMDSNKLLYDRSEFESLRKNGEKRISNVSYVSRQFAEKTNNVENQLNDVVKLIESALPMLPADDTVKKNLLADVKQLFKKFESYIPRPGVSISFDFMTKRGFEGYSYNWGENRYLDGSKRLSLLNHVGGIPIGFFALRTRYTPEDYQTFVEVAKLASNYGEQIGLPLASDENREQFQKFRKVAVPLLERLDKVIAEKLIPAFKDGQAAIVFDAKLKSRQWHPVLPTSDESLPFPELALVYSVSNAKLLRDACSETYKIAQEFVDKMHELYPDDIPQRKLPGPETTKSASGTLYGYSLPADFKLDSKFSPNAGLSEGNAVLSLSKDHSERLLRSQTLDVKRGPIAERGSDPTASVCLFNWPGLVDAIKPWVEFGVEYSMASDAVSTGDSKDEVPTAQQDAFADIMDQIETGAEILKCYRGYSSVTYVEGTATITHRESVWQDLSE
jgi:hypothetical protein